MVGFYMLHENSTDTIDQLRSIRSKPSKFICLNDNMDDPDDVVRCRPSFSRRLSIARPKTRGLGCLCFALSLALWA